MRPPKGTHPPSGSGCRLRMNGAAMNEPTQGKPTVDTEALRQRIVELMQTVYDPEIPVNIYELGMVYDIQVDAEGNATVTMTLTSPACPVAGSLPGEVEWRLGTLDGLKSAKVNLVWEPPWTPEKMSEAAKLQLGMM